MSVFRRFFKHFAAVIMRVCDQKPTALNLRVGKDDNGQNQAELS